MESPLRLLSGVKIHQLVTGQPAVLMIYLGLDHPIPFVHNPIRHMQRREHRDYCLMALAQMYSAASALGICSF